MNFLEYSSSSESDDNLETTSKRKIDDVNDVDARPPKKRLPPPVLPAALQNKYKAKVENKLATNSGGKLVEFIPGNWSTIVYISVVPTDEMLEVVKNAMAEAQTKYPELIPVKTMDDGGFHISLSKTIFLKAFQIPRFIELLKARVSNRECFGISFSEFNSYINDEYTKTFLSLDVGSGSGELETLTRDIDTVLKSFSQPVFYENPKYHTSIGYLINSESMSKSDVIAVSHTLRNMFSDTTLSHPLSSLSFALREVHCKTGDKLYRFPLLS
ncbi:U6 snRNA phosphodiesterase Usb1 [Obelidium mucronatum]|nr:U6 snRNA phosphodiesterase Usb1 [Obelidium mucronatum]